MRTALHDMGKRMPAAGGGGGRFAELTFEELKRFASEKEEQIEALQQGLREWEVGVDCFRFSEYDFEVLGVQRLPSNLLL